MFKRFQTQNLYVTSLTQGISPIGTAGDPKEEFSIYVSEIPSNTEGFVFVNFTNKDKQDLIEYHGVDVGTSSLLYYRCNRDLLNTGAIDLSHDTGDLVQINDVAQRFNYLFSNTDDFGMIKAFGKNNMNVQGGRVFINDGYVTVADLVTTSLANGTYTAILDYSDNTLKLQTDVSGIEGIALGQVVVSASDPVITDWRGFNAPLKYDPDIFQIVGGEVRLISGVAISQATTVSVGSVRLGTTTDHQSATTGAVVVQTSNLVKTSSGAGDENKVPILNPNGKLAEGFLGVGPTAIVTGIKGIDAGGDDAYVITLDPVPAGYVVGMEVILNASSPNTGACDVDVNELGVKSIKASNGEDPKDGEIPAGVDVKLRYDGTNFVIIDSPKRATDAVALAGTNETDYINSKQLKEWAGFTVVATSDEGAVLEEANTERSTTGAAYEILKEIEVECNGVLRVEWQCYKTNAGSQKMRIYKNSIADSPELNPDLSSYSTTFTYDITVATGDLIQFYANAVSTGTVYVRNFKIYGYIRPSSLVTTVNTD